MTRRKRRIDNLKFLLDVLKNWDFYTKDNSVFFQNKCSIFTKKGHQVLTKSELQMRIDYAKDHIRRDK